VDLLWRQSGGGGKIGVIRDASGISRLFGAAKLQFAPGANNPRYYTACLVIIVSPSFMGTHLTAAVPRQVS